MFGLSISEEKFLCRNVHLGRQIWHRMIFTFNPWVYASAGGLYVHKGLYSPAA
jgi:hypothetical protein